jgi:type IV conjugative transfer system protein TraL
MSDLDNYIIPKLLDAPNMALWFEADTAAIGLSGLVTLALPVQPLHVLGAIILSVVVARYYARIKTGGGRGLVHQMVYWYLPGNEKNQPINPAIREYRG